MKLSQLRSLFKKPPAPPAVAIPVANEPQRVIGVDFGSAPDVTTMAVGRRDADGTFTVEETLTVDTLPDAIVIGADVPGTAIVEIREDLFPLSKARVIARDKNYVAWRQQIRQAYGISNSELAGRYCLHLDKPLEDVKESGPPESYFGNCYNCRKFEPWWRYGSDGILEGSCSLRDETHSFSATQAACRRGFDARTASERVDLPIKDGAMVSRFKESGRATRKMLT